MPDIKKSLSKKYLEGPLNPKGNKEKNKKESVNEGIISSLLAKIISFALSGHMKQIDSLIDPQKRKDVAIAARNLKDHVAKYNKHLNDPNVKKIIQDAGLTVEDFYIDKL